jgi:hypothetical protein
MSASDRIGVRSAQARSRAESKPPKAFSTGTIVLREEIAAGRMRRLGGIGLKTLTIELRQGHDSVWVFVRRKQGARGGVALRAAFVQGGVEEVELASDGPRGRRLDVEAAIGRFEIQLALDDLERPVLRVTTRLTPRVDTLITHLPRDLYMLDENDDPTAALGHVEAAQRGLNVGLVYARFETPDFGDLLYVQNLTALNPYFNATQTKPDGAVGGEWPELGYLPPTPPQAATPPVNPLPGGESVVLSDAILVIGDDGSNDEQASALKFLQMLAAAYPAMGRPVPELWDWIGRSERTIRDLDRSPDATLAYYGARYVRPYTGAEYPDSMVQLSVLAALKDWEAWTGEPIALTGALMRGVNRFHDKALGTLRRYLPNVGEDKNADAVDSWYLYHPLLNLGRLAHEDEDAKALFVGCLDFAIKAARHFQYAWPIQFDVKTFKVLVAARNADGLGQTDVGGLYTYIMMQAFELTGDSGYVDEAKAAMAAARGMRFELEYQANLTAWGAAGCLRLYRVTSDRAYLDQSYVYLASLLHNTMLWESEIAGAAHYQTFLGATCLHDAPYMALYECYDCFCALEQYLKEAGPELDDRVRLLVSEFCRFTLSRAWFYYPDALPKDLIATSVRNGHIDRALSFPVEDLYGDGQPAGQVGQEIYGCGAAPSLTVRAFHRLQGAPFMLFCDQFVADRQMIGETSAVISLTGSSVGKARVVFLRGKHRRALPKLALSTADGALDPSGSTRDRIEFIVPADARLVVAWE